MLYFSMFWLARFDDWRVPVRRLVGEDKASGMAPVWGLNSEGEVRGAYRELHGLPNMWLMLGMIST